MLSASACATEPGAANTNATNAWAANLSFIFVPFPSFRRTGERPLLNARRHGTESRSRETLCRRQG